MNDPRNPQMSQQSILGSNQAAPVNPGVPAQQDKPAQDVNYEQLSPEQQQKVQQIDVLSKEAIGILYGDEQTFQRMIEMFQTGGTERFPRIMSTSINAIIDRIEQTHGQLDDETLAGVGMTLLSTLAQDVTQGGVVQLDEHAIQQAAIQSMQDWMKHHADRVDKQGALQAAQQAGAI
jgi:hypothetical protein